MPGILGREPKKSSNVSHKLSSIFKFQVEYDPLLLATHLLKQSLKVNFKNHKFPNIWFQNNDLNIF